MLVGRAVHRNVIMPLYKHNIASIVPTSEEDFFVSKLASRKIGV